MSKIYLIVFLLFISFSGNTQDLNKNKFRNFPIVITVQFQSFSMPFKNIKGHFKNIGIGIGTEISHSGNLNWVQHFDLIWYRNKAMGNGLVLSTQSGWRPYIVNPMFTEIKLGIAYYYGFRPSNSYNQTNGYWENIGKRGKGIFAIPAGIMIGSHDYKEGAYISPFLGYQFMLTTNYNKTLPVTPWSSIQLGTSIHAKN